MKAELAFDVCWEVYRAACEVLETKQNTLSKADTWKFLWRSDCRPRLNEWVADFALAGMAALDGSDRERVGRKILARKMFPLRRYFERELVQP